MSSRSEFLANLGAPLLAQLTPQASVAVEGPMTGPEAQSGLQLLSGVRGALDDANGQRALLDRFWTLRTFDDQGTLAQALLVSKFAMDDQNQLAAIGHLSGKITNDLVRYYANVNMPLIVPATTYDRVTSQGYRNVFRLPTKDSTEGILHAKYVKRENRGKAIAVVYFDNNDVYGIDVARAVAGQARADGLTTFEVKLPTDRPDFDAAARSTAAQHPDLVFLSGLARDLGPMIPALRTAGFHGVFDGPSGFFDGALAPSYGDSIEGLVISTSMPPLQIVPSALAIKTNYEQHYGAMTPLAAFGYAATQIFITGVRRFPAIARITIARALAQPIAIDTLVGSFTFDPFGDPQDPNVYFYELRGGTFRYLRAAHPSSYIVR